MCSLTQGWVIIIFRVGVCEIFASCCRMVQTSLDWGCSRKNSKVHLRRCHGEISMWWRRMWDRNSNKIHDILLLCCSIISHARLLSHPVTQLSGPKGRASNINKLTVFEKCANKERRNLISSLNEGADRFPFPEILESPRLVDVCMWNGNTCKGERTDKKWTTHSKSNRLQTSSWNPNKGH